MADLSQSPRTRNLLLSALPAVNLTQLLSKLRMVDLPVRTILSADGANIDAVYFLESG